MTIQTMMPKRWAALLVFVMLPCGAVMAAPAPAPDAMTSRVIAASGHVKRGGAALLTVALADKTLNAANAVVDLEVYNAKGVKIAQNAWQGQKLVKGSSSVYHWSWKPNAPGSYTVKVGVFGAGWKPIYHWNDKALALTVS